MGGKTSIYNFLHQEKKDGGELLPVPDKDLAIAAKH